MSCRSLHDVIGVSDRERETEGEKSDVTSLRSRMPSHVCVTGSYPKTSYQEQIRGLSWRMAIKVVRKAKEVKDFATLSHHPELWVSFPVPIYQILSKLELILYAII